MLPEIRANRIDEVLRNFCMHNDERTNRSKFDNGGVIESMADVSNKRGADRYMLIGDGGSSDVLSANVQ